MRSPEFEFRSEGDEWMLSGYASVFDAPYDMGTYSEEIRKGAFKRTLNTQPGPEVSLLVNHQGLPLAHTRSGTLTLAEDDIGLRVRARLDRTDPDVISLIPKLKRSDVTEMSFAFSASGQEWSHDFSKRVITEASIQRGDVSIVTTGANPHTSVKVRHDGRTVEQREAKAQEVGRALRGGIRYSGGLVVSDVLAEPSLLTKLPSMARYKQRAEEIRTGTSKPAEADDEVSQIQQRRRESEAETLRAYRQNKADLERRMRASRSWR